MCVWKFSIIIFIIQNVLTILLCSFIKGTAYKCIDSTNPQALHYILMLLHIKNICKYVVGNGKAKFIYTKTVDQRLSNFIFLIFEVFLTATR